MSDNTFSRPRGTADIIPSDIHKWHYIESELRNIAKNFGYNEIRFPTFEHTELFTRGVGDTTDVVQKEMYTFTDKGGRSISLRPEGTASTVRAYIENSLYALPAPFKVYYIAPNFRYEKPQSGRLREHHQFGAELFGSAEPCADAEIISLCAAFLDSFGVKNARLFINSIGCADCRPAYFQALHSYFSEHRSDLCDTCMSRLDKNPMRILDCKVEKCKKIAQNAPKTVDFLCDQCSSHLKEVTNLLDSLGIEWSLDTGIVRGLDYYTKTVFEFVSPTGTICGGGRYDGLISELGGQPTGALGFGCGLERLLRAIDESGANIPCAPAPQLFLVSADSIGAAFIQRAAYTLRKHGVSVLTDLCGRSVKAQMKLAGKSGVLYSSVIGGSEINSGRASFKNMASSEIFDLPLRTDEIIHFLRTAK